MSVATMTERSLPSTSTAADALSVTGRVVYALPFAVFGAMHLAMPGGMAGLVPAWVPGPGALWVVLTGVALLAASGALLANRLVRWAAPGLALLMLTFVGTIHLPALLGGDVMAMTGLLKDLALAGAALLLAGRAWRA